MYVRNFALCQVDEDEPLFISLIADLFPGIVLDSATYAELQVAIAKQVENAVLINHPSWNLKIVQVSVQVFHRKPIFAAFLFLCHYFRILVLKCFLKSFRKFSFQKTTICNLK